jgi:hypothetical protein
MGFQKLVMEVVVEEEVEVVVVVGEVSIRQEVVDVEDENKKESNQNRVSAKCSNTFVLLYK